MRVLLLGGTGNLGLRLIPALLAHNHTVVAYVRSESKLRSRITSRLAEHITVHVGDALDTDAVADALRKHGCDAVVNTAGNMAPPWREQYLGKIVTLVSDAAVRVGKERGTVLRAWFIGGVTSLVYPYPGNDRRWKVHDFLPRWGAEHHRGTEEALAKVSTKDLEWSVLCVAWMWPRSPEIDLLEKPRRHNLLNRINELPDWRGSALGSLPLVGRTMDLFWCMGDMSTMLEDVADLIAEDLESGGKTHVGCLIGMKDRAKM